jgi:hypothetical protein
MTYLTGSMMNPTLGTVTSSKEGPFRFILLVTGFALGTTGRECKNK